MITGIVVFVALVRLDEDGGDEDEDEEEEKRPAKLHIWIEELFYA